MASISKKAIYDRVALFVQCVRSSDSSINLGFQPNSDWWISHATATIKKKHENAFSLLEQIGVSIEQMVEYYGKYWLRDLESNFPSLQKRQFKNTDCICIRSTDLETTEITPNAGNIVGGKFQETRNSKSPWVLLRDSICGDINITTSSHTTKKRKRSRKKKGNDPTSELKVLPPTSDLVPPSPSVPNTSTSVSTPKPTYFESSEAKRLFNPIDLEQDALVAIQNQIKILKDAQKTSSSYHLLLPAHSSRVFTEYDVFIIRQKIMLLSMSLNNAAKHMPTKNWRKCCEMALNMAQQIGITESGCPRTIMRWYHSFKQNRMLSLPPLPDKMKLHPFLLHNHDIVINIKQYAKENIHQLSAQLILDYLHSKIIPEMIKERPNPENKTTEAMALELLEEYGLSVLSLGTVTRWMNRLGFKYDVRRKNFYVDGHERPGTIKYRKDFVKRYLGYERRAHRWIQITRQTHDDLVDKST